MIVMDGKEAHIEQTAIDLLIKCKLLKTRANSERTLKSLDYISSKGWWITFLYF